MITHIYIHLIFVCLSVCTSCIPAINLGRLQNHSPQHGDRNSASSAVGANGDSLDVIGCIELAVVLDTLNVKHSFIVVKRLTVECILGIDFLSKYGAGIDCANDMVSFGSQVHAADPTPQIGNATANVVIVEETARIRSRSSCIVSATVQNGDALSGRVGILEPHDNIPISL